MKGPTLRLVGTCAGCDYLDRDRGGFAKPVATCTHPSAGDRRIAKNTNPATPAWCPRLHAATLAKARELLGTVDADTIVALAKQAHDESRLRPHKRTPIGKPWEELTTHEQKTWGAVVQRVIEAMTNGGDRG